MLQQKGTNVQDSAALQKEKLETVVKCLNY